MNKKILMRTGKAGENVLDRSVYKRLGKVWKPGSAVLFTEETDLPVRSAAGICFLHAVNSTLSHGYLPRQAQTMLLFPEGSEEGILRNAEDEIAAAAKRYGIIVTGGHTAVTGAASRCICGVSVYGEPDEAIISCMKRKFSGGEDIWFAGWAGTEGAMLLSELRREQLLQSLPARILERAKAMEPLLDLRPCLQMIHRALDIAMKPEKLHVMDKTAAVELQRVHEKSETALNSPQLYLALQNVCDGGIFAALWKLCEQTGQGMEIMTDQIPIRQETVEICDRCDINPYELLSSGALLIAAPPQMGSHLVQAANEEGILLTRIGRVCKGRGKLLRSGEETRCLDMPAPDAILSVVEEHKSDRN